MRFSPLLFFALISLSKPSEGFAILTHEAVIDACWDTGILPTLRNKFPGCDDSSYVKAKAYAYGGAIMPDIGFFPFGSPFFTNLVHYVRSGDFTEALLDEAKNLNEYAFALGALAHYNADNYGHPLGVNVAVPMVYEKDKLKFGENVPYAENPIDHRRMEFAFDVLQVARGNYQKENYNGFIGFELSKSLLERAFLKTYGIELGSVFENIDLAFTSFRWSVQFLIPQLTKAAWVNKKDDILKLRPELTDQTFYYHSDYKEYKSNYGKPPISVSCLALLIKITPKIIGPSRVLRFRVPTPEAEIKFNESFDSVIEHYDQALLKLRNGNLKLPNLDYDTGSRSVCCEYPLANDTYFKWLKKLNKNHFSNLSPELEKSVHQFYNQQETRGDSDLTALYKNLKKEKTECDLVTQPVVGVHADH